VLARIAAACNNAELRGGESDQAAGDPTEIALLELAAAAGADVSVASRQRSRRLLFRFDPRLKLMTTIDELDGGQAVHTKGAPEAVLARATRIHGAQGERPLSAGDRDAIVRAMDNYAARGLRVLALAHRDLPAGQAVPDRREDAERELCLTGLVAMIDPPRPQVPAAIEQAHRAGIRIHVVTGDNGLTAAAIARNVGIGRGGMRVVSGTELDAMTESQLDDLLGSRQEVVFARSSPEAKLRIADALRAKGEVVAMTGDGVNGAPALRRTDIGVAMGRSGTGVAREAATMVLTDDNFATITAAVETGRRALPFTSRTSVSECPVFGVELRVGHDYGRRFRRGRECDEAPAMTLGVESRSQSQEPRCPRILPCPCPSRPLPAMMRAWLPGWRPARARGRTRTGWPACGARACRSRCWPAGRSPPRPPRIMRTSRSGH
jgi:magnesium-transporting ATPase (P-type)